MTEEQLKAIEQRVNAATPGPWMFEEYYFADDDSRLDGFVCGPDGQKCLIGSLHTPNGEFIAHARGEMAESLGGVP